MKIFYRVYAWLFGRNLAATPKSIIVDQLNTPRPLPMGLQEFEDWSDRIISGACTPQIHVESMKATLGQMLLHLGPTEDHKPDSFFIHCIRKLAVNQVGDAMFRHYRDMTKERLAAMNGAAEHAEAPPP